MALVCQKPRLSRPFCQDSNAANLKWLASPRVVPELGRQRLRLLNWPVGAASPEQPILKAEGCSDERPRTLGRFVLSGIGSHKIDNRTSRNNCAVMLTWSA